MKRLNPNTNQPFKRGENRDDNYHFLSYHYKHLKKDGFYLESWVSPEVYKRTLKQQKECSIKHNAKNYSNPDFRAKGMLHAARTRCKKNGGKVTITWEWVAQKIKNGKCELTDLPFDLSGTKDGVKNAFSPSIDRINPKNKNYEIGNVRVILQSLNMALSNRGVEHLIFIVDAMKNKLN